MMKRNATKLTVLCVLFFYVINCTLFSQTNIDSLLTIYEDPTMDLAQKVNIGNKLKIAYAYQDPEKQFYYAIILPEIDS